MQRLTPDWSGLKNDICTILPRVYSLSNRNAIPLLAKINLHVRMNDTYVIGGVALRSTAADIRESICFLEGGELWAGTTGGAVVPPPPWPSYCPFAAAALAPAEVLECTFIVSKSHLKVSISPFPLLPCCPVGLNILAVSYSINWGVWIRSECLRIGIFIVVFCQISTELGSSIGLDQLLQVDCFARFLHERMF